MMTGAMQPGVAGGARCAATVPDRPAVGCCHRPR